MFNFNGMTNEEIENLAEMYQNAAHNAACALENLADICEDELDRRELAKHPEVQDLWKQYAEKYGRKPYEPVIWNRDGGWYEADGILLSHEHDLNSVKKFFASKGVR